MKQFATLGLVMGLLTNTVAAQWIIAHRGASHAAPENTLAAFNLAWQEGADGVEGDFYLSADGHIVCIHDKDTQRTAGKKLVVAESTLAELKKLDVGSWKHSQYAGERIPTLSEVLQSIPQHKRLVIELKTGPEIVQPLAKVLAKSRMPREMLAVIAFNAKTLATCKKQLPDIRAHWLTGYRQQGDDWSPTAASISETLATTGADGLGSQARQGVFDAEFIATLRRNGLKEFHVWTVNDPAIARQYARLGAIGITTDKPGYIRQQLGLNQQ